MGWLFPNRKRSDNLPPRVPLPPAPSPQPASTAEAASAPTPVPAPLPAPALRPGLNIHVLTPEHIERCRRAGVTQVRTTVYAGPFAIQPVDGIDAAVAAGLDVLVVVHGSFVTRWAETIALVAQRWPSATIQVGNECDVPEGSNAGVVLTPSAYADVWREAIGRVPPGTRLVTAAVGGIMPAQYIEALLAASCAPYAVGVHAYGPPPDMAIEERAGEVASLLAQQGARIPIWVTEFGIAPKDIIRAWPEVPAADYESRIRAEWERAAQLAGRMGLGRLYGYCLDEAEEMGYGAPPAVMTWLERAELAGAS